MTKKKRKGSTYVKGLAILPLAVFLAIFIACSNSDNENPEIQKENPEVIKVSVKDDVLAICEKMPKFPGGIEELRPYIKKTMSYPNSAAKKGIQGRVIATFIIEKDGSVSNVKIEKSLDPDCDAQVIKIIKGMPKWIPGEQRGHKVRVRYTLPFVFKIKE